ncbi:MAG: hypothetical protein ACOC22_00795 [bacterium]
MKIVNENINKYLYPPSEEEILKKLIKNFSVRGVLEKSLRKGFARGVVYALKHGAKIDEDIFRRYEMEITKTNRISIGRTLKKEFSPEEILEKIDIDDGKLEHTKNSELRLGLYLKLDPLIERSLNYFRKHPEELYIVSKDIIPKRYIPEFIEIYEDAPKKTHDYYNYDIEKHIFDLAMKIGDEKTMEKYYKYVHPRLKEPLKDVKYKDFHKYASSSMGFKRGFMTYHILKFISENEPVRYTDIIKFIVIRLFGESWNREQRGRYSTWFQVYGNLVDRTDEGWYINEKGLEKIKDLEKKVPEKIKRNIDYSIPK